MLADSTGDRFGLRLANPEPNVWRIGSVEDSSTATNGKHVDFEAEVVADLESEDFWHSTKVLQRVRQFARARRVGPYSLLGVCLAKATASIPPYVVLPPVRGSYGSLNLYVALVGASGTTKSTSIGAGRDLLVVGTPIPVVQPGSGEGLAKCYAYVSGKPPVQEGINWTVLAVVPEVVSMLQTASRGGATLLADWRSGWSGERLGKDYSDATKRIVLQDHRYRLAYVLGIVPMAAHALFEGVNVGTPQRILWLPTADPHRPTVRPEEPPRLKLGSWPMETDLDSLVKTVDTHIQLLDRLAQPMRPSEFEELPIPPYVRQLVDDEAYEALGRSLSDDAEENHDLFNRLKVAASLMRLHKHRDGISELHWQLAGHLLAVSNGLREETQRLISAKTYEQQVKAARVKGKLADAESSAQEIQGLRRVRSNLLRYLEVSPNGVLSESDLRRKLSSRDREPYFDAAIAQLESQGRIARQDIEYHGSEGFQIVLIDQ